MSNLRYDQINWNQLWATGNVIEQAWAAIDKGDLVALKHCFAECPKIHRWIRPDGYDFLDCFAVSANPTAAMLRFMKSTPLFDPTEDACVSFTGSLRTLCADGGSLKAAKLFLKNGADPNFDAGISDTAITLAARRNRLDLVSLLLKHGADPNQRDFRQQTALEIAEELDFSDIVFCLKHSGLIGEPKLCEEYRRQTEFTETTISLDDQTARLQKLFKSAANAWRRANKNSRAATIGVSCCGVKGFVRVHICEKSVEPYAPDCFADVVSTKELTIAAWRNAFAKKDRIFVKRSGKTTKRLTNEALFATRDKPFFDFVRDELHAAMKAGVFKCIGSDDVTYGVQSYYFHHCCCWNARYRKISRPKVWDETGGRKASETSGSTETSKLNLKKRTPIASIKKSANEVFADRANQTWLLQNSRGINRIPFGRRTGDRNDLAMWAVDADGGSMLVSVEPTELILLRARDGVELSRLEMEEELWRHKFFPLGKRSWLLSIENRLILLNTNRQGKLCKRVVFQCENQIANAAVHPSGLVAFNEYYQRTIQVHRFTRGKLAPVSVLDTDRVHDDVAAVLDLTWHPNGFLLGIRYVLENEDDRLLLTDGSDLNVTADIFLGNDAMCGPLKWSADGKLLATKISGGTICLSVGMLDTKNHMVIFDGITLDVLGELPMKDICCYCWHPDEHELIVGGYQESTVWDCSAGRAATTSS